MINTVIIPAAGLGTRLRPRTLNMAKEMIPLGGVPVIWSALLEAQAAGAQEVVVIIAPHKTALAAWVRAHTPASLRLRVVIQPEPAGVVDAVRRAQIREPFAVIYPDYVALPEQRALAALVTAAQARPEATWFTLYQTSPEVLARVGATARVHVQREGERLRITGLATEETGWRTTLAEVRGPRHLALLAEGPADDARVLPILAQLAREGLLYGHALRDPVLDMGVMPGLLDAEARFAAHSARWREMPTNNQ